jgi:hypothetical protein
VERTMYYLPSDGRDAALRELENLARLTEPYRG